MFLKCLINILLLVVLLSVISCKENGNTSATPESDLREKPSTREQESVIVDTIRVKGPERNSTISSPLTIEGEARGYWFFEATAPVEITDEANNILGKGYIEAKGEWMTEDLVPFSGKIDFDPSGAEKGFLVLHRSNPSGLPEHDNRKKIPVKFQQ